MSQYLLGTPVRLLLHFSLHVYIQTSPGKLRAFCACNGKIIEGLKKIIESGFVFALSGVRMRGIADRLFTHNRKGNGPAAKVAFNEVSLQLSLPLWR
jgi:hypothetical protein